MSKLTAVQIRQAKPKDKPYKLPDGQGLYFHVAESGKSTWRYRFRVDGKESTCVLGEYPDMSLEQARKARAEAREQVKAGKNPSHERQKEKQAVIEQQKAEQAAAANSFEAGWPANGWSGSRSGGAEAMPELFWARWNAMPSPLSVTVRLMRSRRRWFLSF